MATPLCPATNSQVRIRDQRWHVERAHTFADSIVVEVIGCDAANRGQHASFVLPFDTCHTSSDLPPLRVTPRGWRRLARLVLATATPSPHSLRSPLRAPFVLMPFQLEPALACLRGGATRILIADAVGLGKTVQAGLIVAEMLARRADGRALIVVPGGLREQWRSQLHHHFAIDADVFDAAGLWRATAGLPSGVNPWSTRRVAITSIDFVKRPEVMRSLESLVWDVIVFDEAHALAGRSDRQTAAAGLAVRGRTVVLLSATPHGGDRAAFARLCGLGDIHGRFPLSIFRRNRLHIGALPPRRSRWFRLKVSDAHTRLRSALLAYASEVWRSSSTPGAHLAMLVLLKRSGSSSTALARSLQRRRQLLSADDSSPDPGDAQLSLFGSDDDAPSLELASAGLDDRGRELDTLDELVSLATAAHLDSAKLQIVQRLITQTREPAVVFTQYRDTLDEIQQRLSSFSTVVIHGGMSARDRAQSATAFSEGSARLLLATDAASEGLNLHQRCRLVISFDLPWTPVRLEQRIGRVDRIGQTGVVHAWQLVAAGSYEETVAARVRERMAVMEAALETLESVDELDAAAAILTGQEPLPKQLEPSVAADARPDLAATAREETRRLTTARAMLRHTPALSPTRAFYTNRTRRLGHDVVAVRAAFNDRSQRHHWETVVGFVTNQRRVRFDLSRCPGVPSDAMVELADVVASRYVKDLRLWRDVAAFMLRRDRAIRALLYAERARLSAALVQPELFSNRLERTITPQLILLDDAIARLSAASADMCAVGRVGLASIWLAFAALSR